MVTAVPTNGQTNLADGQPQNIMHSPTMSGGEVGIKNIRCKKHEKRHRNRCEFVKAGCQRYTEYLCNTLLLLECVFTSVM